MTPSVATVLESAKNLTPTERVDLASELLLTVDDQQRLQALQDAVDLGFAQIDAGHGISIPLDEIRDYIHERALLAAERAAKAA